MATRKETGFRKTIAKNKEFSPRLSPAVAERVFRYCQTTNQNRTKFVEMCVTEVLDRLEVEQYQSMDKDDLIALLMGKKVTANIYGLETTQDDQRQLCIL